MSRRHKHEEHVNHEAWAIPYGDLITLLLAFFVVMYAISTLNEGKYRVLSESMAAAFLGEPRTANPISVGNHIATGDANAAKVMNVDDKSKVAPQTGKSQNDMVGQAPATSVLSPMDQIVGQVETAMHDLIEKGLLSVRRNGDDVEIEIGTDLLFPSGSAQLTPASVVVIQKLGDTLKDLPYAMRVEGHTDNRPINTPMFPSNWELSAARAATVVHLFTQQGVDPTRLTVLGLGQYRPQAENDTEAGRNANRRVRVVILSSSKDELVRDAVAENKPATDMAVKETATDTSTEQNAAAVNAAANPITESNTRSVPIANARTAVLSQRNNSSSQQPDSGSVQP